MDQFGLPMTAALFLGMRESHSTRFAASSSEGASALTTLWLPGRPVAMVTVAPEADPVTRGAAPAPTPTVAKSVEVPLRKAKSRTPRA